jgi:hypothetical protein
LKQAITIDLAQLRALLTEFVEERGGDEGDDDLMRRLTLSDFMVWATNKAKGDTNEQTTATPVNRSNEQVRHTSRFTDWRKR